MKIIWYEELDCHGPMRWRPMDFGFRIKCSYGRSNQWNYAHVELAPEEMGQRDAIAENLLVLAQLRLEELRRKEN